METIQMSQGERRRLEIFSRVKQQQLTLVQASELLAVSYRQAKRLWARYQREVDAGFVRGLRGQASNHQSEAALRARVLALLEEVTRRFEAYNQGNKNAAKLRETIRNPHIWISREVTEDEGPDRWSFVIGFEGSADYAINVEFEGLKCIDVAGGD